MAEITRYTGNLEAFAVNATGTNRKVYASNPSTQSDVLTNNITADFLTGWEHVGPNDFPRKQDFNALGFTMGQLHAYLHQKGVPEWDSAQEYFANKSITNEAGVLYRALTTNTNKQPSASASDWEAVGVATGSSYDVNQVTHGFVAGDVLRLSGATYVKAQADSVANAEVIGVVSVDIDADNFTIQVGGRIEGLSGLTAGTPYFLDPSTAGAVTTTKPTTIGQVAKPVYIPDTTTTAVLTQLAGVEITATTGLQEATQSEQETGTATNVYVSPDKQQYHNSAAKAWVVFNGTGTIAILDSYNVTSVTDNGTGDYTINYTTAFSSVNYAAVVSCRGNNATSIRTAEVKSGGTYSTTATQVFITDSIAGAADSAIVTLVAYGDQ